MISDRIFQVTLLVSLIAHGAILAGIPGMNTRPPEKREKKVELRYIAKVEPAQKSAQKPEFKTANLPKAHSLVLKKQDLIDKAKIGKALSPPAPKALFTKPALPKPDIIGIKKKITLSDIDIGQKGDNPLYARYYAILKEKIPLLAYKSYDHPETGRVYIAFIVFADGTLKEMRIIDEKSSAGPYLKEIAVKSLSECFPLPPFPKETGYSELPVNIIISFEFK